jgi:hypothetical protein
VRSGHRARAPLVKPAVAFRESVRRCDFASGHTALICGNRDADAMDVGESRSEVVLLGFAAVALLLLNGFEDLAVAAVTGAPLQFTTDAEIAGWVSILIAVLLVLALVAYWMSEEPTTRGALSVLLILLGSFSIWVGGGFFVGFLLAVIAGVVGIIFAHSPLPPGTPWIPSPPSTTSPAPSPPSETPPSHSAQGMVVRYCPKCEAKNPADSKICQNCGTALASES